jgi:hypothetical protein
VGGGRHDRSTPRREVYYMTAVTSSAIEVDDRRAITRKHERCTSERDNDL